MVPLLDALRRHAARGTASFHTPGHKGRLEPGCAAAFDLTELPDTGSLYDGGDAIEASERLCAEAFGAGDSFYSAGGCTLCIQTMLLLACGGAGGRILMARNAHRSAVNTAVLLGLEPVWLWPEFGDGLGCRLAVENLDEKLKTNNDIRAVYITSPDYTGRLADVAGMAALCHGRGIPLLVDNAHGSHLGAFGLHPLMLGADMTADSWHKTLPVLTGGAVLHLSGGWRGQTEAPLLRRRAKTVMALFGSTSPSFPVLASIDQAQAWWRREGPDYGTAGLGSPPHRGGRGFPGTGRGRLRPGPPDPGYRGTRALRYPGGGGVPALRMRTGTRGRPHGGVYRDPFQYGGGYPAAGQSDPAGSGAVYSGNGSGGV